MRIEIRGKPDKVSIQDVKESLNWYANKLLGPKLSAQITIRVFFERNLRKYQYIFAECNNKGTGRDPRSFYIKMNACSGYRTTLTTLAHEMVHVKQFARNELVEIKKDSIFKWCGKIYGSEWHYYDQPWEIEAHGREIGLYYMWQESRDNDDDNDD